MSSVQDHAPAVKELSERQPRDSQPSQPEQSQSTQQQAFPKAKDASDPPVTVVTPADAPREYSPPRFSHLLDPLPEGAEPHPPRRGISTGTTITLVNQSSTIGFSNDTSQSRPTTGDRPTTADRRSTLPVDPIRGETTTQVHIPVTDDGDNGRGSTMRRVSVPRPRSIYNPPQSGDGNGTRVSLRGGFGGDSSMNHPDSREPLAKTVAERIDKTLTHAKEERMKYKKKAYRQTLMINGAIAAQVVLGALTTGVAAGSKNIGSAVAVLGGMSTALASFLASARGSGEPENSTVRSRELNTFIREVEAFVMDYGHKTGPEYDYQIKTYRERFELIIKTEGEDSASGTVYAANARGHPQVKNGLPMNGPAMGPPMYNGGYGAGYPGGYPTGGPGGGPYIGGGYPQPYQQPMPSQWNGGNGQLSEKQQLKNEKAVGTMV